MYRIIFFTQPQSAVGRQCRPSRRALQARCLHKALRPPSTGPIAAPADVVYECLTLLRRPDIESLAPFFPAASFNASECSVRLQVGGQAVEEVGPLACCHAFMDTAARRVLPGHLLRRCRVLSSVQLGDTSQLRVALTARTGEEAVFVWRLRRAATEGTTAAATGRPAAVAMLTSPASAPPRESGAEAPSLSWLQQQQQQQWRLHAAAEPSSQSSRPPMTSDSSSVSSPRPDLCATTSQQSDTATDSERSRDVLAGNAIMASCSSSSSCGSSPHAADAISRAYGRIEDGGESGDEGGGVSRPGNDTSTTTTSVTDAYDGGGGCARHQEQQEEEEEEVVTAWVVESIRRDDSRDDDEMPFPSPAGRGPHPRCSPELVVKAQLAALRRGDVTGAASFNLWSRSTSGGWDLHLNAFRTMLRQPSYHVLLTSDVAELGPSALPSGRRMVQEVRLLTARAASAGAVPAGAGGTYGSAGDGCIGTSLVYQLCMQANGCWLVEGIRPVQ